MCIGSVPLRDATTGFHRSHMNARDVNILLDRYFSAVKVLIGFILIAPFPMPDVIALFVIANFCRAGFQRLERIHDNRKRFIIYFNGGDAVRSRITICGQYSSNFLILILDRVNRQHHLRVAHQRWHVVDIVFLEGGSIDNCQNARRCHRLFSTNCLDLRMSIRTADNVQMQHAGQFEIVNVIALTANEAGIFDSFSRVT